MAFYADGGFTNHGGYRVGYIVATPRHRQEIMGTGISHVATDTGTILSADKGTFYLVGRVENIFAGTGIEMKTTFPLQVRPDNKVMRRNIDGAAWCITGV